MTALLTNFPYLKKKPSLKEFIIRKYFDEKANIRTQSEEANQSKTSLGLKYPEHAVVEVSDKNSSLAFKSPEQVVVHLSDNNEINNMSESTPYQRMDLEN